MILTKRFKDNLTPGEAYPLSNAALLEVLADIPQPEIEISYSSYRMTERRFQKTKMGKANNSFQNYANSIIRVQHERTGLKAGVTKEEPTDIWSISVHSIPTNQLSTFREHMQKEGFVRLHNWFINMYKKQGAMAIDSLTIGFDGRQLFFKQFSKF